MMVPGLSSRLSERSFRRTENSRSMSRPAFIKLLFASRWDIHNFDGALQCAGPRARMRDCGQSDARALRSDSWHFFCADLMPDGASQFTKDKTA
eukprot:9248387-Pyramimonas_sp.AAC.1